MYSDSHCHTCFSGDSDTDPRLHISKAQELGMSHLTFTDHHDEDFPVENNEFLLDFPAYWKYMPALKDEFRDRVDIGIGIELGLQPHLKGTLEQIADAYPYDFIIGSTHVSHKIDPYDRVKFIENRTEEEAYRGYFEDELENLKIYDCFDIAGHLDYAVRYGPNRNRDYTWERYGDILDEILKVLIAKGKGIECNTAGFAAGLGYAHPMPDVWKRYRELGGEILTIGSDAHVPDMLGHRFPEAGDFLKSIGFRYYAVYRNRRPEFFPL